MPGTITNCIAIASFPSERPDRCAREDYPNFTALESQQDRLFSPNAYVPGTSLGHRVSMPMGHLPLAVLAAINLGGPQSVAPRCGLEDDRHALGLVPSGSEACSDSQPLRDGTFSATAVSPR
jgi:hypothetical protein